MPRASARTRDIRISAPIQAGPEQVYRALTSARELCIWWLDRAETEARSMGRFRLVWPKGETGPRCEAKGVFVDLEPGGKVAWILDGSSRKPGVPAMVSFHIEAEKRGSRVTVVHAGFPAGAGKDGLFDGCREGWEDCMAKLKLYLESGKTCKAERLSLADVELLRRAGRR